MVIIVIQLMHVCTVVVCDYYNPQGLCRGQHNIVLKGDIFDLPVHCDGDCDMVPPQKPFFFFIKCIDCIDIVCTKCLEFTITVEFA